MKKIFTVLTIALGFMLPMQAQFAPIQGELKADRESKVMRRALASDNVTVDDLVGTYEAYGMSAFPDTPDETWSVSITKDNFDANKVWIQPICLFGGLSSGEIAAVYATFDPANSTLSLPMGQTVYGGPNEQYNMVLGTTADGKNVATTGSIELSVYNQESGIVIEVDAIWGVGNIKADEWWYQALAYTTYTKVIVPSNVYVYTKGNEAPTRIKASQLFFNTIEDEVYATTVREISTDAIAGTYNAYAASLFEGYPDEKWSLTITRDEADANKVWIHPICQLPGLPNNELLAIYATYDEAAATLTIPMGQTVYGGEKQQFHMVIATADEEFNPITTSELVLDVVTEGLNKYIECPYVLGLGNLNEGVDGWWYQGLASATFTRDAGVMIPLADVALITTVAPEAPEMDGFFREGSYLWDAQVTVDSENYQPITYGCEFDYISSGFDMGEIFTELSGVTAHEWEINGLLGLFQNTIEQPFPALSYNVEMDGENYECLTILDVTDGLTCVGTMTLSGTKYECYLGEVASDNNLYTNWEFMVVEGAAMYAGEGACLFVLSDGQPSLLAMFSDLMIAADGSVQVGSVQVFDEPVKLENYQIKTGEYKGISLKK